MLLWLVMLAICTALVPVVGVLCICLYIALYRASHGDGLGRSAAVVVLGDIGRSPRMCYHVESLANDTWKVAIVGYAGVALPAPLQRSSVRQHHLRPPPAWISTLPRSAFVLVAPFKLLLQAASLFWELGVRVHPPPHFILVQTPPALPTLLVVKMVAMLVRAKVVIDWHNLAYTILALRLGSHSRLVRLAEALERWSGQTAHAHLFVTDAMKVYLSHKWHLRGHRRVLHDRPPAHFRRSTVAETHDLMIRLLPSLHLDRDGFLPEYDLTCSTPFTRRDEAQGVALRPDRPALVVSSTSWTADEDFNLLLEAARLYERKARLLAATTSTTSSGPEQALSPILPSSAGRRRPSMDVFGSSATSLPNENATSLPKLLVLVTGKGELKAHYVARIAQLEMEEAWQYVRIRTAWLETADYPVLLGSADAGVSLHTSSSGLDLPMKVVDMLGCGLPVCALDFACLHELVQDRVNGLVFRTPAELAHQWESLLATHPQPSWLSTAPGMLRPFERFALASDSAAAAASNHVVPPSPNPSLTLLHSPVWGSHSTISEANATNTWPANWKAIVRPLLTTNPSPTLNTDPINAGAAPTVELQPPGRLLHRRASQRRLAARSTDSDQIHLLVDHYHDNTCPTSEQESLSTSPQSQLRNRKNSTSLPNITDTDPLIPHIHVSHQI